MTETLILVVIFLLWWWFRTVRKKFDDPRLRSRKRKSRKAARISRFKDLNAHQYEATPSGDPEECWTPKDREISIRDYTIPGGLIYVGEHLRPLQNSGVEPALINPALPVAPRSTRAKVGSPKLGISYRLISPSARAAYLKWLADGRRDPSVDSGCLFLFLYGLERRALFDAITSDAARSQIPEIVKEINRLLDIYRSDGAFESRARDLLDALQAAWPNEPIHPDYTDHTGYTDLTPCTDSRGVIPWRFEFGMARMFAEDKPIPPGWIFTWLKQHPDARMRAPARRCPEELRDLFARHYKLLFGEGVRLEASKSRLRLRYRPVNPVIDHKEISFKTDLFAPIAPDDLMTRLLVLFDLCQDELDPYSRELGKNPETRDSLPALAVLPEALCESRMGREAEAFRSWAFEELKKATSEATNPGEPAALVDVDKLLDAWPTKQEGGLLPSEAGRLARLFERWGIGVEPDPRFGGSPYKAGGKAVLFKLPGNAPAEPTPEYAAAAILMRLSVIVAAADGDVTKEEKTYITNHVASGLPLTSQEKTRLLAHLRWLFAAASGLVGVKQRLKGASEADRRDIGWFLIALAGVDGAIHPDEIKLLSKIYRTLDLDPDELFSHIHTFTTEGSPENGTAAAGTRVENRAKSTPPGKASDPGDMDRGVSLDMEGVRRKMAETAKVSAVLEEIFTEEKVAPATGSARGGEETLVGLDVPHTAMFRELAKRPSWTREEFEALARHFHLPPDGALENINEAAWDIAEEPLCEGDDPMELDQDVLEEMLECVK